MNDEYTKYLSENPPTAEDIVKNRQAMQKIDQVLEVKRAYSDEAVIRNLTGPFEDSGATLLAMRLGASNLESSRKRLIKTDLSERIRLQVLWSRKTFGAGRRTKGICEHIKSELLEIADAPTDLFEWIDVILLALDGAWRAGYAPDVIAAALIAKQEINFARSYPMPDSQDEPTFHKK